MRKELNTRFNGQDIRKVGTANPTVTSGAAIAHACLPSVRLKGWPKSRCELLLNTPEDADAKSKSRALELVSFMAWVKKGATRSFRGKKFRKGPGNFLKIKNRAGACPPLTTGQNLVHAMPSGRSCPSGKKNFVHARLPARSALILEERAAAAVLRQQTYCCCSSLQNRTRFSDEKDLGRNRQTWAAASWTRKQDVHRRLAISKLKSFSFPRNNCCKRKPNKKKDNLFG
jgi:hypothetical protein